MKHPIIFAVLIFSSVVQAAEVKLGDYRQRSEVNEFIERMAKQSDYSEQELVGLFSRVKKQSRLFELLDRPAEKELEWYQYRRIFIRENRIAQGVEFWQKHRSLLNQVASNTGVPAEIIVAIIGVETFYGTYRGKDPVFDSLVTLAFDYPRRSKFFKRELEQLLLLSKEQNLDIRTLRGSYAGAMGMPQFIASSYRNYAVDFDGDGQANLFDSMPDIVASVANYFVKHGWRAGEGVASPLTVLEKNTIEALTPGVKTEYKWSDLTRNGLFTKMQPDPETPVALVKLVQKTHSEYWAGLQNFYVITRYNHSEMYAMAVYQLAQLIKSRTGQDQ